MLQTHNVKNVFFSGVICIIFIYLNLNVKLLHVIAYFYRCVSAQVEVKESKKTKSSRKSTSKKGKKAAVNTEKIDLLLDMIKGADVTSEDNLAENETLVELEGTRA